MFKEMQINVLKSMVAVVMLTLAGGTIANAQANQLSLADILIALRSKKVTLPERNKILSEAIASRGTTFSLTPEIEKELSVGGAARDLIESIKQLRIENLSATTATPAIEEDTPEKRAQVAAAKGDHDTALIEYTRAIELDPKSTTSLAARSQIFTGKGSFTLAINDLSKLIELDPQNAVALSQRAALYEKKGQMDLSEADYRRVLVVDRAHEAAKAFVAKVDAEREKLAEIERAKVAAMAPPPAPKPVVVVPEFVSMGMLSEVNAVRMVKPVYPQIAAKSRIGGQVIVNLELDKEGNVENAKAVSGHAFLKQNCELAARKSKFKPAMFQGQAVKGRAQIVFSFVEIR